MKLGDETMTVYVITSVDISAIDANELRGRDLIDTLLAIPQIFDTELEARYAAEAEYTEAYVAFNDEPNCECPPAEWTNVDDDDLSAGLETTVEWDDMPVVTWRVTPVEVKS